MRLDKIPKEFRKNGYDNKLVLRRGLYVIYRQFNKTGIKGYELHKVRCKRITSATRGHAGYTHWEYLASNEDFGSYGWSFNRFHQALREMDKRGI